MHRFQGLLVICIVYWVFAAVARLPVCPQFTGKFENRHGWDAGRATNLQACYLVAELLLVSLHVSRLLPLQFLPAYHLQRKSGVSAQEPEGCKALLG